MTMERRLVAVLAALVLVALISSSRVTHGEPGAKNKGIAAAAPVPYEVDELEVAAQLAGAPIEMRPCRHIDLMVPATTEIVIEGRFLPNERRSEGPFGEFMGYYVPVGPQAVFEVLGITQRPDAVFHSILCGSSEEVL